MLSVKVVVQRKGVQLDGLSSLVYMYVRQLALNPAQYRKGKSNFIYQSDADSASVRIERDSQDSGGTVTHTYRILTSTAKMRSAFV